MSRSNRRARGYASVSRLRKKLARMPDDIVKDVRDAISDSAEVLRFEMLQRVPVDTGMLAETIEIKLGRDKLSARVGPGARTKKARKRGFRALFLEFGTRHMAARPFIFPALEARKTEIKSAIDNAVDRALRRVSEKEIR
jgi:HK97 gp10 family phage protein